MALLGSVALPVSRLTLLLIASRPSTYPTLAAALLCWCTFLSSGLACKARAPRFVSYGYLGVLHTLIHLDPI